MDIRFQISEIIDKINPIDEQEKNHKNYVKNWIASGADLFRIKKPATPKTHLVSYFIPYDQENDQILLVHHKKVNLWLPPGGHVDLNEHPRITAQREMEEELFAKADFLINDPLFLTVSETVNESSSHTDVSLWFVVKGSCKKQYKFDEREFYNIAWYNIADALERPTEPHLQRFLQKLKALTASLTNELARS